MCADRQEQAGAHSAASHWVPGTPPSVSQALLRVRTAILALTQCHLVAAEYVLDFGYVIKGTQKVGSTWLPNPSPCLHARYCCECGQIMCWRVQPTCCLLKQHPSEHTCKCPVCAQVRKFKVVNTGSLGVTFTMDTKSLEKSGFTVTPDKLPLLAGAPVHASLELTVTLQVSVCATCWCC